ARIVDLDTERLGDTLSNALERRRSQIAAFADTGTMRLSAGLAALWDEVFPMVIAPSSEDGLGILLINSTAETHFSFTNALGLVSSTQAGRILAVLEQFPR